MRPLIALVITIAVAAVDDKYFTDSGKTDGSGSSSLNNDIQTESQIECGLQCLSDKSCDSFSMRVREEGGYYCMKTTCPSLLPPGKWSTYKKNGPAQGGDEAKIQILHRQDGCVSFERVWADYQAGFGDSDGEHWLGLDNIYDLSTKHSYGLNVTMTTWDGQSFWTSYSIFTVGPESDNYRLSVSGYDVSSTAGDSLSYHNNMAFSTLDRDNDKSSGDCSADRKGGWWYNSCTDCNPTGRYVEGRAFDYTGISWYRVPGYTWDYSFKEMTFTLIRQ